MKSTESIMGGLSRVMVPLYLERGVAGFKSHFSTLLASQD